MNATACSYRCAVQPHLRVANGDDIFPLFHSDCMAAFIGTADFEWAAFVAGNLRAAGYFES